MQLNMVMYGYVRLLMVMYGYQWLSMVISGYVWLGRVQNEGHFSSFGEFLAPQLAELHHCSFKSCYLFWFWCSSVYELNSMIEFITLKKSIQN